MRKQYHLRPSAQGYYAWDVERLIELAKNLEHKDVLLTSIGELDENFWFGGAGDVPTCRAIAEHIRLINEVDLNFPITLCSRGRVMDGMHRLVKALLEGRASIAAVQFTKTPKPDYVDVYPDELPY
jgi:hypothetical protein